VAFSSAFLLIYSFSIQVFPNKSGKGALFSTNLMTSNSSSVDVSWEIIGVLLTLPHRVIVITEILSAQGDKNSASSKQKESFIAQD
jgi:hypothetical protein